MSGQIWAVSAEGGYMYSNELSDVLRQQVQPLTKFRQLCDAQDGSNKGLNRGDKYFWNVYSNVATQGGNLSETDPMPETSFTVAQRSLTVGEAGNSVPYTGKLSDLAKHDVVSILDKTLKDDARKYFDISAFNQFNACALRASSTTSATSITLDTGGVASQINNVAFGTGHVKAIVDAMKEQYIPPYIADDYVCVSHPSTFRNFKNQLEAIH